MASTTQEFQDMASEIWTTSASALQIERLRDAITNVYNKDAGSVASVIALLEPLLKLSADLAALGADVLYEMMESSGFLAQNQLFHLHCFVSDLTTKVQSVPSSDTTSATKIRTCGLSTATQLHVDLMHTKWVQEIRFGGNIGAIVEAANMFPEQVDVMRLIRDGYSNDIAYAFKAVDFIELLQPNWSLVMIGFRQLFKKICYVREGDDDQVDTLAFMQVVHRFKQASAKRGRQAEPEFNLAKREVPAKIRAVFFPPSGNIILYSSSLNRYAASDFNVTFPDVTYMVKDLSPSCKFKLTSIDSPTFGQVFKIGDGAGKGRGLYERKLPEIVNVVLLVPVAIAQAIQSSENMKQSELFRYLIQPHDRGNFFTIMNITVGGVLIAVVDIISDCIKFDRTSSMDTCSGVPEAFWKIVDYEDAVSNASCLM